MPKGGYLQKVKEAIKRQDGRRLAECLTIDPRTTTTTTLEPTTSGRKVRCDIHNFVVTQGVKGEGGSPATPSKLENMILGLGLPSPLDEVVLGHVLCARCLYCETQGRTKVVEAYANLTPIVPLFVDYFRQEEETWVVAPLHAIVGNIRRVAELADEELKQKGKKPDKLENAGNQLMSCFAAANRPQGNPEKRLATLRIVNDLFRIYFKLNTLRNCKYLIRVVEAKKFVAFKLFAAGDRVTYKFFIGRLAVFDEDFVDADAHLTYAFEVCHPNHLKNRRLILKYLVPVKILIGKLPSEKLLHTYNLHHMYSSIKQAVKSGSVRQFEHALQDHMESYVTAGTYLLIEKLRVAVYRRLFKKVQRIFAEFKPERAVQVPLKYFVEALKWEGYDTDLDEVECIVANMVYRKYIKGYISHKNAVIVLSKKDPFPKLDSSMLVDPQT